MTTFGRSSGLTIQLLFHGDTTRLRDFLPAFDFRRHEPGVVFRTVRSNHQTDALKLVLQFGTVERLHCHFVQARHNRRRRPDGSGDPGSRRGRETGEALLGESRCLRGKRIALGPGNCRGRSLSALACSSATSALVMRICTWPFTTSCSACAPPCRARARTSHSPSS